MVQWLRALAALAVILFHSLGQLQTRSGFDPAWRHIGAAGVDLFFVLSGFIMWVTALNRDEAVRAFIVKRVIRIVPLYWLMTSLVLAIASADPRLMQHAELDDLHVVFSYLFIAWPHPAMPDHLWPLLIPGWTLNYEMFFYTLVAIALGMPRAWRAPLVATVIATLVVAGQAANLQGVAQFYTDPVLLEFLAGIGIGMSTTTTGRCSTTLAASFIGSGILLFGLFAGTQPDGMRVVTWGLPLALATLGCLHFRSTSDTRLQRFLGSIGDASYSLYLTQFLVIPAAAAVTGRWLPHEPGFLTALMFVIGLMLSAFLAGIFAHRYLELPLLKACRWLLLSTDSRFPSVAGSQSAGQRGAP
jgi:exopolysaccharide production protein ExoZ